MKIENSYKMVRQHTLYKSTRVLETCKLLVTELKNPNIHYDFKNEVDKTQIKCLRFTCSIEDFNQLPSDILASCKTLIKEYSGVTQIEFLPALICNSSYLDLLIDSRDISSNGDNAKICLKLIQSIHLVESNPESSVSNIARCYMPNEVCDDISGCIYSFIKSNGYSTFVNKFQKYFEPEQSHDWAVKGTAGSFAFAASCCWGFLKTLPIPGYHLPVLAACMIMTIPTWRTFVLPEFAIKRGEINFDSYNRRLQLTKLYEDIGGKIDYQLWEDQGSNIASLSIS